MNKTIGVLGGMGPIATVNFLKDVVNNTKAVKDWEHVHMIVDFDTTIPSRGRHIMLGEESPVEGIRKACFKLMSIGCEKIFVPCNSAHYFYDEVVENTDIPWVNMLQLAADKVKSYSKVLVLGAYTTILKRTYDKYISNVIYLKDNTPVFNLIENIKSNVDFNSNLMEVYKCIDGANVDCVLLACTELPLAIKESCYKKIDLIDVGMLYVRKLIISGGSDVR
jgi:aspartate racemase